MAVITARVSPLAELVYSMLPRPKITEILDEVNSWTTFTRHFSHIKNDITRPDTRLLLTTILADGITLGLTKMAEACPGSTKSSLEDIQAWYIRGKPLICTEGQSEKSYFLLKRQLAITPACGGHTHQEETQKARDTSAVPGAGDISGNTHS